MTIEARLYRDPSSAATLKIGQQIARNWLAEDRAAAEEQRKTAEAALEKLEAQVG